MRYQGNASFTNLPYASVTNPPNPLLRWERNEILNVGVDFRTKGNVLSGTVEYFTKQSKDLLAAVPYDPTTGFSSLTVNAARLKGSGVEVNLSLNVGRRAWQWNSQLFFSTNRTKVADYYSTTTNPSLFMSTGLNINPRVGKDAYAIFSYRWMGLDGNGDPVGFYNGAASKDYSSITGKTTPDSLVYHGSALPKVFGAWRNTFSWKQFSFSFNIAYRFGHYFRNESINYNALYTQWKGHADFAKRWQKPGDEAVTYVPSMPYPSNAKRDEFYTYASVHVQRADNIRLQDASLAYSFNERLLRHIGMKTLSLTAMVSNAGILWRANNSGVDPDYGGVLPPRPTFSLVVKTHF
jgi:hypothetical protein